MEHKKTILIVEDEEPLQNAIRIKMEKSGFATLSARSAQQALNYLEEMRVDVVWIDHYLLGKEDGLYIVTKMKDNDSKWRDIPIFVVSNTASKDKVQSYLKFGVDKYFTKAENRLEDIIQAISSSIDNKD